MSSEGVTDTDNKALTDSGQIDSKLNHELPLEEL